MAGHRITRAASQEFLGTPDTRYHIESKGFLFERSYTRAFLVNVHFRAIGVISVVTNTKVVPVV